jgi:hypothetical protein
LRYQPGANIFSVRIVDDRADYTAGSAQRALVKERRSDAPAGQNSQPAWADLFLAQYSKDGANLATQAAFDTGRIFRTFV